MCVLRVPCLKTSCLVFNQTVPHAALRVVIGKGLSVLDIGKVKVFFLSCFTCKRVAYFRATSSPPLGDGTTNTTAWCRSNLCRRRTYNCDELLLVRCKMRLPNRIPRKSCWYDLPWLTCELPALVFLMVRARFSLILKGGGHVSLCFGYINVSPSELDFKHYFFEALYDRQSLFFFTHFVRYTASYTQSWSGHNIKIFLSYNLSCIIIVLYYRWTHYFDTLIIGMHNTPDYKHLLLSIIE